MAQPNTQQSGSGKQSFAQWATGVKPQPKRKSKKWIHPPGAMLKGCVIYTIRFLGVTEVEKPKGNEVVREAIKRLKFSAHVKLSEGLKPPKVDLGISCQFLRIQEAKTKLTMHQISLKRISYCADDKQDKRIFAFIAKDQQKDAHSCYVFDTEKLAEEITLSVGQAFDLAYKQFAAAAGQSLTNKKKLMEMEKKVKSSEDEKDVLRRRIAELEMTRDQQTVEVVAMKQKMDELQVTSTWNQLRADSAAAASAAQPMTQPFTPTPAQVPMLEGLGRSDSFSGPVTAGGAATFSPSSEPLVSFGETDFPATLEVKYEHTNDLDSAIADIEKKLAELQSGFDMGEGFTTEGTD